MKVYAIVGETGEWEDSRKWISKVFLLKEKAELYMKECQDYADHMMEEVDDFPKCFMDSPEDKSVPDKQLRIDYTGTKYSLVEYEVEE
jgi:hypothetical protein